MSLPDASQPLTATSIEDVFAGAMWVNNLTDAQLSAQPLHETFMQVIFSFVRDGDDGDDDNDGEAPLRRRLRTAAERERERRVKAQLRREVRELHGAQAQRERRGGGDDDGDGDDAHDTHDENDDYDDDDDDDDDDGMHGFDIQDQEFLDWIDTTQHAHETLSHTTAATRHSEADGSSGSGSSSSTTKTTPMDGVAVDVYDDAIELELDLLGLGAADAAAAADALPERLRDMEVREGRPRLRAKTLPGGYTYDIPLAHEAYWVLRQLRNAGQPLAHNTRICALANRAQPDIADEPVVVALTFALQKMTRELLEPAVLMLYHQTELHPLLCALLENSALAAAAAHTVAVPSYAYSTVTGRRQQPYVSDAYVGFDALCVRNMGGGGGGGGDDGGSGHTMMLDGMHSGGGDGGGGGERCWEHALQQQQQHGADYAQRKPCFVELGRLLVRVLELDALCHRLEYRRQQLLIMLRDSVEARVQDQRGLLESIVFESSAEADVWHTFTQVLTGGRSSTGARHRVRELGLDGAYEEYTITGLQYQENLLANAPLTLCPVQQLPLQTWAAQVGRSLPVPRSGEAVVALFNAAIVDEFSTLPVLCRHVMDLFCAEGDLIVTYRWTRRRDEVYPLASFFAERPEQYMTLLHMERQGTVVLHYVLDTDLVRRVLNVYQLYQRRTRPAAAAERGGGGVDDWGDDAAGGYQRPHPHSGSGGGIIAGDDADLDDWTRERAAAMELLVLRLTERVTAKVKAELYQQALYHLHMACVQRLALVCAQGAYEPTYLCLDNYAALAATQNNSNSSSSASVLAGDAMELMTWEPSWNVVEALPCVDDDDGGDKGSTAALTRSVGGGGRVLPRRVCAAYRASNSVTYFAMIDEYGAVVATTRWVDCAMGSAAGRAAALLQSSALERLFVQHTPAVIAVGASEVRTMGLVRTLRRFVRERVHAALRVHVPVVWASCEVARYCAVTRYADDEFAVSTGANNNNNNSSSAVDYHVRTAVMLARYVQDPLLTTCLLFDARRTVLQLCLDSGTGIVSGGGGGGVGGGGGAASSRSREHEEQLYHRLCWEMSLWVSGSGVWLDDVVRRPHAAAVMQFVAGLGPSKARVLHESVCTRPVASRAAMMTRLRDVFGDLVSRNASSLLRVPATTLSLTQHDDDDDEGNNNNDNDDEEVGQVHAAQDDDTKPPTCTPPRGHTRTWHVLDQTLIPFAWYDVAAFVAAEALRMAPHGALRTTKANTITAAVKREGAAAAAVGSSHIHAHFSDDDDDGGGNEEKEKTAQVKVQHTETEDDDEEDEVRALASALPMLALYELLDRPVAVRRALLVGRGTQQQQDLYARVQAQHRAPTHTPPGERELELVLEELIACGASFLRRPYRRLSSRELMTCLTGVTYMSGDEATRFLRQQQQLPYRRGGGAAATTAFARGVGGGGAGGAMARSGGGGGAAAATSLSSSVVCEGDYIVGTIRGVRGGALPGLHVQTSRGVAAFIAAVDVDDEAMRVELLEHIRHLERTRDEHPDVGEHATAPAAAAATDAYHSPEWLRRGAPIQGLVLRCNWQHCTLHLRWCRPLEVDVPTSSSSSSGSGRRRGGAADGDGDDDGDNYDSFMPSFASGLRDGAASSVNTLRTTQMERDARVFATKISRHPLFRDVSSARAVELLHDKEIGETLLRPTHALRNRAVCVVKVGAHSTSNWAISEERRPDGRLFYRMKDKVVGMVYEYDEVDEFLRNYIAPMVQLVLNVRHHRRFQETMRDVATALADQQRSGYGFTYAFVESSQSSYPPHYRVVTRGGGREHRFRLHITDRFIYVRLPFRVDARTRDGAAAAAAQQHTMGEMKWVQCRSAEHVSETIKKHAVLYS